MAEQSGLTLRLRWEAVPRRPGYAEQGFRPGGTERNVEYYTTWIRDRRGVEGWELDPLADPGASRGLLLPVESAQADALERSFVTAEEPIWRIGEAVAGDEGAIEVV